LIKTRAHLGLLFHPNQPRDNDSIGIGLPYRLMQAALVNLPVLRM
jgi:hypothetical protein